MIEKLRKTICFIKTNKDMKIVALFAQGNIFVYILIYIQTVLINRGLNSFDLGKLSYYQSLFIVILSVVSLTIYTVHLRFLGFVDAKKLISLTRKILVFATFLFSLIVLLIWGEWIFIPFAAMMWFNEQLYYFRALTKIKLYTAMKCIQHVILISLIIGLMVFDNANYKAFLLATGLAYLATYLFFYKARKRCPVEQSGDEEYCVKDIFKYCAPGAVSVVSLYMLSSVDQVFINTYLLSSDLANYAMAIRTLAIIQLFTAVFMDYWPRFYFERAALRDYSSIKRIKILFSGAIIVFSVLCILLSEPLYYIIGAKAYIGTSTEIFAILAFGEIFRIAGSINMTYRSFTKESIYNVVILGGLGLIKLASNYLFIEEYGLNILVLTTVGSYIAYWIMSYFFSIRAEKKYMFV